jgi:hypothetical protein
MAEEVTVRLGVDSSSLSRGLREAGHSVQEFAHSTTEQFADAFKGLASGFTAEGIFHGIEGAIGKAKEIERVAAATGLTAEQYQRLSYAFRETGIESAQLEKSLEFLSKTVGQAGAGEEAQVKLFEKWGIAFKNVKGEIIPVNEVFGQIIDKVSAMHDPASKAALDMDLLAKSGAKFVAAMAQGRAEIDKKGKGAAILSDDDLANLDEANARIEIFTNRMTIFYGKLVSIGEWWGKNSLFGHEDKALKDQDMVDKLKAHAEYVATLNKTKPALLPGNPTHEQSLYGAPPQKDLTPSRDIPSYGPHYYPHQSEPGPLLTGKALLDRVNQIYAIMAASGVGS